MVLHAGTEACEGVRLTAEAAAGFDAEDEDVPPFVTVGVAAPVGSSDKAVLVDATALAAAAEPMPALPQPPQSMRTIGKTKDSRKNSDLWGSKGAGSDTWHRVQCAALDNPFECNLDLPK